MYILEICRLVAQCKTGEEKTNPAIRYLEKILLKYGEFFSMLYGDVNGKEIQKRGDMCIWVADSLCCTMETNTAL